jgi:hypothetical protein
VHVPDVMHGEGDGGAPGIDQGARGVTGTVIGDEDFIRQPRLQSQPLQDLGESQGCFVGAD